MIKIIFVLSTQNDFVDFDEMTKALEIAGCRTRRKTEFPLQSVKAGVAANEWSFDIKGNCRSVSGMIDKMQAVIKGKETSIIGLCRKYDMDAVFTVVIEEDKDGYPEIFLTKENVKFLNSINAEIGFDIY